ncbi:NUDIX domain-containing protein [Micromonospora sp. 4G55]|uniref:NUDIX domain-containing protein n=1 Tax=Micromonospora sp. 4G55 TaxID=2806102 RepID=UPI0035C715F2
MPRGPWTTTRSRIAHSTPRFNVHQDEVTRPDGTLGEYDWIETSDQVRVAALVDEHILLVEQYHYLIGRTLQLPGGNVEHDETSEDAAKRELEQETGYRDGKWTNHGRLCPLPGLSPAYIHLWVVRHASAGTPKPESAERDLRVVRLPIGDALRAAYDNKISCAASAALVFAVASALAS